MRLAVLGVAIMVTAALAADQPAFPSRAREWIEAVRLHQPGALDPPALAIAEWRDDEFEKVRSALRDVLAEDADLDIPENRNGLLRRGAMLHADIAILAPERAQRFVGRSRAWLASDGTALRATSTTGHWAFARELLDRLKPDPGLDQMAREWYVATTSDLQYRYNLADAYGQLNRALELFPADAMVLFLAGAMHEAFASARFQSAVRSIRPPPAVSRGFLTEAGVQSARVERDLARRFFQRALAADPGLVEARVRHGRVLGQLGRHEEAIDELRKATGFASEPLLQYYAILFLGEAEASLGRFDAAAASFERAAALYPDAQSPLLSLSVMAARRGDRTGVLNATRRLVGRPADIDERVDPWWSYHYIYARSGKAGLRSLRESISRGRP